MNELSHPAMMVRPDQIHEPLFIVCPVFNPIRYRSRWKLYYDFQKRVADSGAILYTVEVAFGERDFVLTEAGNPCHVQLRTSHELWIKENAINLGFQRLPLDWKYAGWCDSDVLFARADIWNEILHQLQHYSVVQPWSESVDLGPNYEILQRFKSFGWCLHNVVPPGSGNGEYYIEGPPANLRYWHPGYSLFFRREAYDALGGMLDYAILGGGDLLMLKAISNREVYWPHSLSEHGVRWYKHYHQRAQKLHQNVGYCDGLVTHFFHGKKSNRAYKDRGFILVHTEFNPEVDIARDGQGLWQLTDNNIPLRDGIRDYLRSRNEDDPTV